MIFKCAISAGGRLVTKHFTWLKNTTALATRNILDVSRTAVMKDCVPDVICGNSENNLLWRPCPQNTVSGHSGKTTSAHATFFPDHSRAVGALVLIVV